MQRAMAPADFFQFLRLLSESIISILGCCESPVVHLIELTGICSQLLWILILDSDLTDSVTCDYLQQRLDCLP